MQILIWVFVLIVFAVCKKVEEQKIKQCAKKNSITDITIVDKMMTPGYSTINKDEKVSTSCNKFQEKFFLTKFQCFGLCIVRASGCMNLKGKLIPGKEVDAPDTLDKTKIIAAVVECSKLVDEDSCEQAYKQWICLLEKARKV